MDHAFPVPRAPLPVQAAAAAHSPRPPPAAQVRFTGTLQPDVPFMNNMDEISFWISTKQAPCLFNYDNVIKRQCEEAQCSKPKSVQSVVLESPSPKKKKKRKLSLLDDTSVSSEKQQNIYFETSHSKNQQTMLGSFKSDSRGSDLDFNIKNSPLIDKRSKRSRYNKSKRTTLHKKNMIATSTPKVNTTLRRSLRKAQGTRNNNTQLNSSFEVFNCEVVNGINGNHKVPEQEKAIFKTKQSQLFAGGDPSLAKQNSSDKNNREATKVGNGQFDDLSDVSGFTANYIRSTKINSIKKMRNLRGKGSRNFINESKQEIKNEGDTMLVCINKSINTGIPRNPVLNCSTDSSQNIINLVTLKNNDKSTRVNRSTSILKFMETKSSKKMSQYNETAEKGVVTHLNDSFHSKSSINSRYPKRHKNSLAEDVTPIQFEKNNHSGQIAQDKLRRLGKSTVEFNSSDRKENPDDKTSRTRSGKCIGLTLRPPENSVLVLSNSMEQDSSLATMNVATPLTEEHARSRSKRRKCTVTKQIDSIKKQDKSGAKRDKSGFTACFSDSDEDSAPIKGKKFFC